MTCRRCHREITSTPYGYGHVANPANNHHRVTLARSAADRSSTRQRDTFEGSQPQSEGHDPSTEPSNATRGARERGSRSRNTPSGIATQLPAEHGSSRVVPPLSLSLRAPLGAGRRS